MLRWIFKSLVLMTLAVSAHGQGAPDVPFFMPTPEGWRTETIAFPFDFAPELDYEGFEEIRFAPGMFKQGSEDFWSYTFLWWLSSPPPLDAETLSSDLESYFRGLTMAVSEGNGFDPGEPVFEAAIRPASAPGAAQRFSGEVRTLDAFATRQPIQLNVRIEIWACESQRQQVVFFQLSPQPSSHAIWTTLESIRDGFRCTV